VEDMIPRRITAAEMEEERQREAQREETTRTAWMIGVVPLFGGGVSWNLNDVEPNYFKSLGGQWNMLNIEFYKRNLKFFRLGMSLDFGGIDIDKDAVSRMHPNALTDSDMITFHSKISAFARLYPVDFLFLSGGIGLDHFSVTTKGTKLGSSDLTNIDVVNFSTQVFPVGGGIFLGFSDDKGFGGGLVVEALYNIVQFKGRTAKYMSVNAGLKINFRITEDKKYVREII